MRFIMLHTAGLFLQNVPCTRLHKVVTGIHFFHCYECSIRLCIVKKSVGTCAECDEYKCLDLNEFLELVPYVKRNIEHIRNVKLKEYY